MTAWDAYSRADFDASKADRRALRQARQAAGTGQDGLFFVPTPERETSTNTAPEVDGQEELFGAER